MALEFEENSIVFNPVCIEWDFTERFNMILSIMQIRSGTNGSLFAMGWWGGPYLMVFYYKLLG